VWHSWDSLGDTIGRDADILVARSTDGGLTWSAPAALNTNASTDLEDDWDAQVTTDGLGTWAAVWVSDDSLGDTIGTDWDILVARSTDDGITWTAPAVLNTNAASDRPDDFSPQLTTDAQGTWVAVWVYEDPH
jgi:Neuraminidase (sialidase)